MSAKRSGGFVRLFAVLFAVIGAVVAAQIAPWLLQQIFELVSGKQEDYRNSNNPFSIVAVSLIGVMTGAGVGTALARLISGIAARWERLSLGAKVTIFVGVFSGIIAALPFLFVFSGLGLFAGPLATFGVMLGFSSVAIYALKSMEEILPWNRGTARARRSGVKLLDTSVIIDGRVYDVARTGFLEGPIYVPQFVLEELQHIADSADPLRRQRGRRGLDVLRLLQDGFQLEVGTQDKLAPENGDEVDSRLVRLAKLLGADLVTNDMNLNRVASLQGIRVLNLNDLSLALKPNVLPRELLTLPVVREGNQPGQGVGYLDDGTMVVIEHGKRHIGETVTVSVTQVIQTERGKMIFAETDGAASQEHL